MRTLRWLFVAATAVVGAAPVMATTGVSIDVSRINVTQELAPGDEYELPTFGARNPGTDPTSYTIVVSYVDEQEAHQPPSSWFTFSPSSFTLDAGQSRAVSTSLEVPPDAEAGHYTALIGPQIAAEGSGPQIGAGAAARLSFTVAECDGFECWLRWIIRWIGEHLWVLLIPLALLAFVVVRILRRRFAFSIQRRPA
ncbi:MAG TPA: hypothetical protein VJ975_12115 [Candidatus Limnocylindria bacterium]|nr:hypothetical protein [Candidatus Limnocylindria bacterium]